MGGLKLWVDGSVFNLLSRDGWVMDGRVGFFAWLCIGEERAVESGGGEGVFAYQDSVSAQNSPELVAI